MKTNPNDPAFVNLCNLGRTDFSGISEAELPPLTKREYFAAMALQGLLAGLAAVKDEGFDSLKEYLVSLPDNAVVFSESLIRSLNKEPKK